MSEEQTPWDKLVDGKTEEERLAIWKKYGWEIKDEATGTFDEETGEEIIERKFYYYGESRKPEHYYAWAKTARMLYNLGWEVFQDESGRQYYYYYKQPDDVVAKEIYQDRNTGQYVVDNQYFDTKAEAEAYIKNTPKGVQHVSPAWYNTAGDIVYRNRDNPGEPDEKFIPQGYVKGKDNIWRRYGGAEEMFYDPRARQPLFSGQHGLSTRRPRGRASQDWDPMMGDRPASIVTGAGERLAYQGMPYYQYGPNYYDESGYTTGGYSTSRTTVGRGALPSMRSTGPPPPQIGMRKDNLKKWKYIGETDEEGNPRKYYNPHTGEEVTDPSEPYGPPPFDERYVPETLREYLYYYRAVIVIGFPFWLVSTGLALQIGIPALKYLWRTTTRPIAGFARYLGFFYSKEGADYVENMRLALKRVPLQDQEWYVEKMRNDSIYKEIRKTKSWKNWKSFSEAYWAGKTEYDHIVDDDKGKGIKRTERQKTEKRSVKKFKQELTEEAKEVMKVLDENKMLKSRAMSDIEQAGMNAKRMADHEAERIERLMKDPEGKKYLERKERKRKEWEKLSPAQQKAEIKDREERIRIMERKKYYNKLDEWTGLTRRESETIKYVDAYLRNDTKLLESDKYIGIKKTHSKQIKNMIDALESGELKYSEFMTKVYKDYKEPDLKINKIKKYIWAFNEQYHAEEWLGTQYDRVKEKVFRYAQNPDGSDKELDRIIKERNKEWNTRGGKQLRSTDYYWRNPPNFDYLDTIDSKEYKAFEKKKPGVIEELADNERSRVRTLRQLQPGSMKYGHGNWHVLRHNDRPRLNRLLEIYWKYIPENSVMATHNIMGQGGYGGLIPHAWYNHLSGRVNYQNSQRIFANKWKGIEPINQGMWGIDKNKPFRLQNIHERVFNIEMTSAINEAHNQHWKMILGKDSVYAKEIDKYYPSLDYQDALKAGTIKEQDIWWPNQERESVVYQRNVKDWKVEYKDGKRKVMPVIDDKKYLDENGKPTNKKYHRTTTYTGERSLERQGGEREFDSDTWPNKRNPNYGKQVTHDLEGSYDFAKNYRARIPYYARDVDLYISTLGSPPGQIIDMHPHVTATPNIITGPVLHEGLPRPDVKPSIDKYIIAKKLGDDELISKKEWRDFYKKNRVEIDKQQGRAPIKTVKKPEVERINTRPTIEEYLDALANNDKVKLNSKEYRLYSIDSFADIQKELTRLKDEKELADLVEARKKDPKPLIDEWKGFEAEVTDYIKQEAAAARDMEKVKPKGEDVLDSKAQAEKVNKLIKAKDFEAVTKTERLAFRDYMYGKKTWVLWNADIFTAKELDKLWGLKNTDEGRAIIQRARTGKKLTKAEQKLYDKYNKIWAEGEEVKRMNIWIDKRQKLMPDDPFYKAFNKPDEVKEKITRDHYQARRAHGDVFREEPDMQPRAKGTDTKVPAKVTKTKGGWVRHSLLNEAEWQKAGKPFGTYNSYEREFRNTYNPHDPITGEEYQDTRYGSIHEGPRRNIFGRTPDDFTLQPQHLPAEASYEYWKNKYLDSPEYIKDLKELQEAEDFTYKEWLEANRTGRRPESWHGGSIWHRGPKGEWINLYDMANFPWKNEKDLEDILIQRKRREHMKLAEDVRTQMRTLPDRPTVRMTNPVTGRRLPRGKDITIGPDYHRLKDVTPLKMEDWKRQQAIQPSFAEGVIVDRTPFHPGTGTKPGQEYGPKPWHAGWKEAELPKLPVEQGGSLRPPPPPVQGPKTMEESERDIFNKLNDKQRARYNKIPEIIDNIKLKDLATSKVEMVTSKGDVGTGKILLLKKTKKGVIYDYEISTEILFEDRTWRNAVLEDNKAKIARANQLRDTYEITRDELYLSKKIAPTVFKDLVDLWHEGMFDEQYKKGGEIHNLQLERKDILDSVRPSAKEPPFEVPPEEPKPKSTTAETTPQTKPKVRLQTRTPPVMQPRTPPATQTGFTMRGPTGETIYGPNVRSGGLRIPQVPLLPERAATSPSPLQRPPPYNPKFPDRTPARSLRQIFLPPNPFRGAGSAIAEGARSFGRSVGPFVSESYLGDVGRAVRGTPDFVRNPFSALPEVQRPLAQTVQTSLDTMRMSRMGYAGQVASAQFTAPTAGVRWALSEGTTARPGGFRLLGAAEGGLVTEDIGQDIARHYGGEATELTPMGQVVAATPGVAFAYKNPLVAASAYSGRRVGEKFAPAIEEKYGIDEDVTTNVATGVGAILGRTGVGAALTIGTDIGISALDWWDPIPEGSLGPIGV